MLEETGQVLSVEGEFATVSVVRQSSCGSCSAKASCGVQALSKVLGQKARSTTFEVINSVNAKVGEHVVIAIPDAALIKGATMVYITPLVFMILFAIVAKMLSADMQATDFMAVIGGVVGFMIGLSLVRYFGERMSRQQAFQPVTVRKQIIVHAEELTQSA